MLEEGLDVGVRIGELPDSSMNRHPRRPFAAGRVRIASVPGRALRRSWKITAFPPVVEWEFAQNMQSIVIRVKPRLQGTVCLCKSKNFC